MRKFVSRAKRGLLLLAPAVLLTMSASAADRVNPALAAAMQRDLGLSQAQLSQYYKIERLATQQEKQLAAAQGRTFAGSWIEKQADGSFRFVVASTSGRPQKGPDGVVFRTARNTLASLNANKAQLDAAMRTTRVPGNVYGWYVDVKTNSVVVAIGKGGQKAGIDFVAASGADARTVRFVVEDEAPTLRYDLQGGSGYLRNPGDGYLYVCSIGFNATKGSTPVYATAGHCGNAGEKTYRELTPQWTLGTQIGTFTESNFPGVGESGPDMAYVTITAGHTQNAAVEGWSTADVVVKGSTEAPMGAAICRSGRTSFWRCGTIDAKNQTVNYSSGEQVVGMTRTTACSEGGDSGGSFITTVAGNAQAQGVLSGGSGSCKGKQPNNRTRSYFQPINPLLSAFGLTLKTG
jgi:hypothetical protein